MDQLSYGHAVGFFDRGLPTPFLTNLHEVIVLGVACNGTSSAPAIRGKFRQRFGA